MMLIKKTFTIVEKNESHTFNEKCGVEEISCCGTKLVTSQLSQV